MPSRLTPSALAVALGTTAAVPASADPTFGIGFSLSFGGGQPQRVVLGPQTQCLFQG